MKRPNQARGKNRGDNELEQGELKAILIFYRQLQFILEAKNLFG